MENEESKLENMCREDFRFNNNWSDFSAFRIAEDIIIRSGIVAAVILGTYGVMKLADSYGIYNFFNK